MSGGESDSSASVPYEDGGKGAVCEGSGGVEGTNVFPSSVWRSIMDYLPAACVMRLLRVCRSLSRMNRVPLDFCDNSQYRVGDYAAPDLYTEQAAKSKRYVWRGLRVLECDDAKLGELATSFPNLIAFDTAFANMSSLEPMQAMAPSLNKLVLKNASALTSVQGLSPFAKLQMLHISWSAELEEVDLGLLETLTEVNLYQCQALTRVVALPPSLERLSVGCPAGLSDIAAVTACPNLTKCDLTWCDTLQDITPLAQCQQLKECDLAHCSALVDVSPLGALQALTKLDLSHCKEVRSVAGLVSCQRLVDLKLVGCTKVVDIAALCDCQHLRNLDVSFCDVSDATIEKVSTNIVNVTHQCRNVNRVSIYVPPGSGNSR